MTLTKNYRTHTLKKRIDYLHHADIIVNGTGYRLQQIRGDDWEGRLKDVTPGQPQIISLAFDDRQYIVVHPIPDKDYECQIIGSIILIQ